MDIKFNFLTILVFDFTNNLQHPPFVIKDENSPRGFKGYYIDLLDEIARALNFKYVIYEVEDGLYGILNDEGEWNGMMRELMDKKADIGIPLMSITSERDSVIDFTVPFSDDTGQTILMKREIKSRALFKFLEVLEWKVWMCILVAFLSARYECVRKICEYSFGVTISIVH